MNSNFFDNVVTTIGNIDPVVGIGGSAATAFIVFLFYFHHKRKQLALNEPVSKLSEKTEGIEHIDSLMEKIAQEAKEEEALQEQEVNINIDSNEEFRNAFRDVAQEIQDETNKKREQNVFLSPNLPENQTIWVNWMLHISGKAQMKDSMIELKGHWGTKFSVEQLKQSLQQEAKTLANGQTFSCSVLSVSPLID